MGKHSVKEISVSILFAISNTSLLYSHCRNLVWLHSSPVVTADILYSARLVSDDATMTDATAKRHVYIDSQLQLCSTIEMFHWLYHNQT